MTAASNLSSLYFSSENSSSFRGEAITVQNGSASLALASLLRRGAALVNYSLLPGVIPVGRHADSANVTSSLGVVRNTTLLEVTSAAVPFNSICVAVSFENVNLLQMTLVNENDLKVQLTVRVVSACAPEQWVASTSLFVCRLLPLVEVTPLQRSVGSANRAAAAVAGLVSGSPVGSLTLTSAVSVLALGRCVFSDVDPLEPSVNPLGGGRG
jgi:hypothetical protein